MELENKVKCVLMDFEINEITLQEATKRILLLLDVVAMLPSDDEIEQAAKEEADRLHQFGDDTEWYARSLGFIDGAEFVKDKLLGNYKRNNP